MMIRILTIAVIASAFSSTASIARQLNSEVDTTAWMILADAGLFPAANRAGVGWYPYYSTRAGFGGGTQTVSGYLFVDYYSFGLSEAGGLHEYLDGNARRRDVAVYPAIWIYRLILIGGGIFSTHADHVRITSSQGVDSWSGGDTSGLRLFGTIGLTWDIRLAENITVPVGIYYRNSGYYVGNGLLAIRAGFNLKIQ